jgi:uncharacterized protein
LIHVQPGAARTEYAGPHGDALKFRVAAPPVEGQANETLCRALAERLGVVRGAITIATGSGSRRKRVLIRGVTGAQVREALGKAQVKR